MAAGSGRRSVMHLMTTVTTTLAAMATAREPADTASGFQQEVQAPQVQNTMRMAPTAAPRRIFAILRS